MGLLDPDTSDGRVIFFLPWQRHTIAGTTDLPCKVTHNPKPTEDEIVFILEEVKNYLNPDVEGELSIFLYNVKNLIVDIDHYLFLKCNLQLEEGMYCLPGVESDL